MNPLSLRPTLGVIIRFRNAAGTLPSVLEGLRRQTVQPDLIVGVDNQSGDNSAEMLRAAGGTVLEWTGPYHHARVLNFALEQCPTDLVLVLSSHTVLRSPDALDRLVAAMADPLAACASGKWDTDCFYSDNVDWAELEAKGLKFGSIYSNSMGVLRRSLWQEIPFDETLITMEDGAWALAQVKRGYTARRLSFDFDYNRSGKDRAFTFALLTFKLAARYHLKVTWLGLRGTLVALLSSLARRLPVPERRTVESGDWRLHGLRLWASLSWRWQRWPIRE